MRSSFARRVSHGLDRVIFHNNYTTRDSRGLFRIVFALFVLLVASASQFKLGGPLHPIAPGDFPQTFWVPPLGPMMLFNDFPHPVFFDALAFVLMLALVSLLFGFHTRTASLGVGVALLLFQGFTYSFGKIDHFLLFSLVPLIMAFSDWGRTYSLDGLRARRRLSDETESLDGRWTVALLAMLLGLMFATSGLSKAGGDWLNPQTQAVRMEMIGRWVAGSEAPLAEFAATAIHSDVFWESLDWLTVLFEVGFLVAWLHRGTLRLFCAVAVLFHAANMALNGLNFTVLLIVYGLFVPWDSLLAPITQRAGAVRRFAPFLARNRVMVPTALALTTVLYFLGPPLGFVDALTDNLSWTTSTFDAMVQALVALLVVLAGFWIVVRQGTRAFSRRHTRPQLVSYDLPLPSKSAAMEVQSRERM